VHGGKQPRRSARPGLEPFEGRKELKPLAFLALDCHDAHRYFRFASFLFVFGGLQVNKEYWAGVCTGFLLGAGVGIWVFIWSLTS
jgi:hypothetical protein